MRVIHLGASSLGTFFVQKSEQLNQQTCEELFQKVIHKDDVVGAQNASYTISFIYSMIFLLH